MLTWLAQAQDNGNDIKDAVSDTFSWTAALQYAVLLVTLLSGLLLLGRALNKRITSAANDAVKVANETKAQLQMSNGHRAGDIIEQIPVTLDELKELGRTNRDLAQTAIKLSMQNREDLSEHKVIGHPSNEE